MPAIDWHVPRCKTPGSHLIPQLLLSHFQDFSDFQGGFTCVDGRFFSRGNSAESQGPPLVQVINGILELSKMKLDHSG